MRLIRPFQSALVMVAFLISADALAAKQCRDDHGKFIKCPTEKSAPAAKCRDITTKKFAKCGAPNTESVPNASS